MSANNLFCHYLDDMETDKDQHVICYTAFSISVFLQHSLMFYVCITTNCYNNIYKKSYLLIQVIDFFCRAEDLTNIKYHIRKWNNNYSVCTKVPSLYRWLYYPVLELCFWLKMIFCCHNYQECVCRFRSVSLQSRNLKMLRPSIEGFLNFRV